MVPAVPATLAVKTSDAEAPLAVVVQGLPEFVHGSSQRKPVRLSATFSQAPAWQTELAGQTLPQLPQLFGSLAVSPQAGAPPLLPHATNSPTTTAQANPGTSFISFPFR